ncbi:TPA: hypothetical protein N2E01_000370 [Clostridium botulinum]|nr:hypothetical protein [Clostridium botulinum]MBY6786259.1 hypothetical protein [Clostridium botulinum]MBY6795908.1 hypothetical protein [Clostridium botulinum]MBY6849723.1 hypothetical protein [Clostridium botulinum]MBY6856714.1 hypothetical protein [Clostridium botulinum]
MQLEQVEQLIFSECIIGSIVKPPLPFSSAHLIIKPPNSEKRSLCTKNDNSPIGDSKSSLVCSSRTILKTGPPQPLPAKNILNMFEFTLFSFIKFLNSL